MSNKLDKEGLQYFINKLVNGDVKGKGLTPNELSNKEKKMLETLSELNESGFRIYIDRDYSTKEFLLETDIQPILDYFQIARTILTKEYYDDYSQVLPQTFMPHIVLSVSTGDDYSVYNDPHCKISNLSFNDDNTNFDLSGKYIGIINERHYIIDYKFNFNNDQLSYSSYNIFPLLNYTVISNEEYNSIVKKEINKFYFITEE